MAELDDVDSLASATLSSFATLEPRLYREIRSCLSDFDETAAETGCGAGMLVEGIAI